MLIVGYRRFGTVCRSFLQGTAGLFKDGNDRLYRNVDTNYDLTLYEVPAERESQLHSGERL